MNQKLVVILLRTGRNTSVLIWGCESLENTQERHIRLEILIVLTSPWLFLQVSVPTLSIFIDMRAFESFTQVFFNLTFGSCIWTFQTSRKHLLSSSLFTTQMYLTDGEKHNP